MFTARSKLYRGPGGPVAISKLQTIVDGITNRYAACIAKSEYYRRIPTISRPRVASGTGDDAIRAGHAHMRIQAQRTAAAPCAPNTTAAMSKATNIRIARLSREQ